MSFFRGGVEIGTFELLGRMTEMFLFSDVGRGVIQHVVTLYCDSFFVNPLPLRKAVQKQKKNILESFQFSIVTIKKISSPWKPEISLFRHFPKLKIAYANGKNPFNFSYAKIHSKYFWLLRV